MPTIPPDDSAPTLFEVDTVSVTRPRRNRRAASIDFSPDIKEFERGYLPQGLIASKLSIDAKGLAAMLSVYASENGSIDPAPSHVELAAGTQNGHPAEVVRLLNEMIVAGWLTYIAPQHYQWGNGEPQHESVLMPPSDVAGVFRSVAPPKTVSRDELGW